MVRKAGGGLEKVLGNHAKVVNDGYVATGGPRYRSYAISTLRGGVGKSTLSFNLAFEIARQKRLLLVDLCAQCNLTETVLRGAHPEVTIEQALQPVLLGPAFGEAPSDLVYRVSHYCEAFKPEKATWIIPGSP